MEEYTGEQNEYAENKQGDIIYIMDVERGTRGFWCVGCKEPMQAVRRTIEHYKSYFRHEAVDVTSERKCTFSSEQARRILAMDILARTRRIKAPNLYKYSPDGETRILLKETDYVEAASVRGRMRFYYDEDEILRWQNIDLKADGPDVLLNPDLTFFDINQKPILLIQFVEKYKISNEQKLKIRELGIDLLHIILPRDSPENIAKSLTTTQNTKWAYSKLEQNTTYAQLQQRIREGISTSDLIEMGFFQETFACRENQISNFIRKVRRYLESQYNREIEGQLRSEIERIENDTSRYSSELEYLRGYHRNRVEKRYSDEIKAIEDGEREFKFSLGATQD
jgi:hypothetical protein